jgi:predicted house-cleaning noncanonical NTP pyrophosphatase (MazG superfamily)
MAREYDKLVRDRIPEILEADGERPVTHVADDAEYERRLRAKLNEEVREYREDRDPEELADVLEVVHALRELAGLTEAELAALRAEKAAERGRFADRIVLERVE